MVATAAYIKAVATELDPAQGVGILWANVITDGLPDVSAPFVPDGYNTAVCDALGMIEVTQRQFNPGGVRAIVLTPPPAPP
jgi:hypothetical protein